MKSRKAQSSGYKYFITVFPNWNRKLLREKKTKKKKKHMILPGLGGGGDIIRSIYFTDWLPWAVDIMCIIKIRNKAFS